MQQELAGTSGLGDARFVKNEIEAQVAALLGLGVVMSTTLRGGLLYTLDGTPSMISDRFMLGGPSSVRGFRTGGIGPRDQSKCWNCGGGGGFVSPGDKKEGRVRGIFYVMACVMTLFNRVCSVDRGRIRR